MLFVFFNTNITQLLTTPKMEAMHVSKAQIINIAFMSPSLLKYLISFIKTSTFHAS